MVPSYKFVSIRVESTNCWNPVIVLPAKTPVQIVDIHSDHVKFPFPHLSPPSGGAVIFIFLCSWIRFPSKLSFHHFSYIVPLIAGDMDILNRRVKALPDEEEEYSEISGSDNPENASESESGSGDSGEEDEDVSGVESEEAVSF